MVAEDALWSLSLQTKHGPEFIKISLINLFTKQPDIHNLLYFGDGPCGLLDILWKLPSLFEVLLISLVSFRKPAVEKVKPVAMGPLTFQNSEISAGKLSYTQLRGRANSGHS